VSDDFDVVVVGSGAGGGVVAGELAMRGRTVLLLEAGPHQTAAEFTRFEAKATHELWWPSRRATITSGGSILLLAGRCVGGGTTINTKVALRAHERDLAKWYQASGLTNAGAEPFSLEDLLPFYERVENVLGVRRRDDWPLSVRTVEPGFRALGASLEPVRSYTDSNCMRCGSCLQGCPTNAGKSSLNSYVHPALTTGLLDLRAGSTAERVLVEDRGGGPEATGVEYLDGRGTRRIARADAVVVAAGTLNSPQLLVRSGLRAASGGSASSALIGRNLGFHPTQIVYGLFDEPQDCHMVYPITAHCMDHQHDEDGGYVIEATTIIDPIGFATTLCDEEGPLWGPPLVEAMRRYRHWIGLLVMANDDNHGSVIAGEDGTDRLEADFGPEELRRIDRGFKFSSEVLRRSGARRILWSGLQTTHVQGTCRMGDDPERSVVSGSGESHDVKRLFLGDGSVIPCTLSVNPSLTIMALATRLAEHLDADANGYLERRNNQLATAARAGQDGR
jgi:choline dehydrogenase-like flavoprotein